MKIGEVLKELRLSRGLTQVQVQKSIGISQTFLSQLERGNKQPGKEVLKKLCELYEVPTIVVLWKSMDKKDVPRKKRKLFDDLKPVIDSLVDGILQLS